VPIDSNIENDSIYYKFTNSFNNLTLNPNQTTLTNKTDEDDDSLNLNERENNDNTSDECFNDTFKNKSNQII